MFDVATSDRHDGRPVPATGGAFAIPVMTDHSLRSTEHTVR
jgi:hypothetical protein